MSSPDIPPPAVPSSNPYWSRPAADLLNELGSGAGGLSTTAAEARLKEVGPNSLKPSGQASAARLLLRQFSNPLVIILIFAAVVSAVVGEGHEAAIIAVIVLASSLLSFYQEWGASRVVQALQQRLSHQVTVLRDGKEATVTADAVVPGDLVRLSAGALIPADGVIIEAVDFNVSEAALTGETFPVVKAPGVSPSTAAVSARGNCVLAGTSVRSGTATALIVATGPKTEFAHIAEAIGRKLPETDFARGVRRFGTLMTQIMLVMVVSVFVANLLLHRPMIDSLLFSLALAVGITPELLPAIISITLSRGARRMAQDGVIVRRLEAIENLGSMDVLCTDKTGTLTAGVIQLDGWVDTAGERADHVLDLARINAGQQTGLKNPLDDAILATKGGGDIKGFVKTGEVPYDFQRKCLSVIGREQDGDKAALLVCKGAVQNIVDACTTVAGPKGDKPLDAKVREAIETRFRDWSGQGLRVLAVASRRFTTAPVAGKDCERELTLQGFLLFLDPPKDGIAETLKALQGRGIRIKMITGDNRYVARHLAEAVGFKAPVILTGDALGVMSRDALFASAPGTDIFAEIDPNQKERIVAALRQAGHVVGYLGDGINDVPALHEADIGISVEGAVDVARETADMILLRKDLDVLRHGVDDGRKTFVNTLKYVSITTSANFGNMISMALASLFLPFLPLLAKQILLNNFLSDVPSMAIATDTVDAGVTRSPKRWSIGYIRRFMVVFGLISTVFDIATFAFLMLIAKSTAGGFQTGWFVESLVTELAIVLVVRTRQPIWKSRPSRLLVWLSAAMAVLAVALPYSPLATWFGFVPLPPLVLGGLGGITLLYLAASEAAKHWFFRREQHRPHKREA